MTDRNLAPIEMIVIVAKQLGVLCDSMTFLGGAVVGLLITDHASRAPRATKDVDVTIEIGSTLEYYKLEEQILQRGFRNDVDGPICRYEYGSTKIDVMPASSDVLGFSNSWYSEAIKTAERNEVAQGNYINLITPACFLATKLEAFNSPTREGHGDMFASQDFEDIVVLIDGRPSIASDVTGISMELRKFLYEEFSTLLLTNNIEECIEAHLEFGMRSRVSHVVERFRAIRDATTPTNES